MSKKSIISGFKVLSELFEVAKRDKNKKLVPGKDINRVIAYQNALSIICNIPGSTIISISVIKKGDQRPTGKTKAEKREVYITTNKVKNALVPSGIGNASLSIIQEYISKGKSKVVDEALTWMHNVNIFTKIYGVTDTVADFWMKKYNADKNKFSSPIAWIKKNADALPYPNGSVKPLTKAQKIWLKYHKDLIKRIPRKQIDKMKKIVRSVLTKAFGKNSYKMEFVGSYRRGAQTSGDIDILFASKKFDLVDIVQILKQSDIIVETMSKGKQKFSGVCHFPGENRPYFHIDVYYTSHKSWEPALMAYTGSMSYNIKTRASAAKRGTVLNQYGLFNKSDKKPLAYKEKKILKLIGEPYIIPACR